jgi:hypothetical protein
MRSHTVTTVLRADHRDVFAYMADIENLPEWATEFARELRCDEEGYLVINNLGEFRFEIRADAATGVIDMLAGPSAEEMVVFPTRAVALTEGRTAYTFTMFQSPGMPDELFESQYESLKREFANIEARFDRREAC